MPLEAKPTGTLQAFLPATCSAFSKRLAPVWDEGFLFALTERGDWAISYLQHMLAFDNLLCAGRFPGAQPLAVGDRIPLRSPITGTANCVLRNAIISHASTLPASFVLPSGQVDFITFTGVTDNEISFANINGKSQLIERLVVADAYPVTTPTRASIL